MKIFRPVINDYKFKTQRGEAKIFDTVFHMRKHISFHNIITETILEKFSSLIPDRLLIP